jgi:hypothetical protein
MKGLEIVLLFGIIVLGPGPNPGALAQTTANAAVIRVSAGNDGGAEIVSRGRTIKAPKLSRQEGIADPQTSDDGRTAGWLATFKDPDSGTPFPGSLVIWRGGHVIRVFNSEQSFYSWAFEASAAQVAYHVGPLHGERVSHCELHDVNSGRLLAQWDGDLTDRTRPSWAQKLSR